MVEPGGNRAPFMSKSSKAIFEYMYNMTPREAPVAWPTIDKQHLTIGMVRDNLAWLVVSGLRVVKSNSKV